MRTKNKIIEDGSRIDILMLEVLLDMRELLIKQNKRKKKGVRVE